MKQFIALIGLLALLPLLAHGQSRTAERIVSVPFSSLRTSDPDGSVRHVVGAAANASGVCVAGAGQMMASKISGTWKCSDIPGGTGGSGAPTAATYITQTSHAVLTNEQALSGLATGLLKNTTTTGVLSIALPGTDFLTPTGNGSQLTALNAAQLTTGTVPDARFPLILPAISGANLTALNASQLNAGTVPDARFPATLPPVSGANLTNLNASNIASGTIAPARLGTGSGGATKFLREDSTFQTIPGGGDALTASPLSQFAATTSAQLAGVINDETGNSLLVYNTNPVLVTPTIGSFLNAGHDHTNAVGGGQLTDAALSSAVQISKGGTGQTTATAGFNALDPLTTKGDIIVHDGTNSVRLAVGTNGQVLKANSATSTGLEWGIGAGTGDVVGPASATDNAVVRFDLTTGKLVQNSGVTIDDSANVATAGEVASGVGSSVAGTVQLGEGTAVAIVANTVQHSVVVDAPAAGTQYLWGAAASSGILRTANSSGVMTVTHDAGLAHLASSTSADLAGVLTDETGNGGGFVRANNATLVAPALGAATATTINGLTISPSTGSLTIANAKTATVNNTLTFAGTDGTTQTFQGSDTIVGRATTDTLTNKTIDGDLNTVLDLPANTVLKAGTIVPASNILATVTNSRCLRVNGSGVIEVHSADCGVGAGGADTALSNLASVAINTTLSSDADLVDDLGTPTNRWKDLHVGGVIISGKSLTTEADQSVGSISASVTLAKNDTNTRTFYGDLVKPIFNTGGSNTNTTFNVLAVDTTNTSVTGLTTNLLNLAYGGSTKATVTSGGNLTVTGTVTDSGGTMAHTIASGTASLGTSAIASGACATAVTVAATGTATTDVIGWGFNGDPTAVTGYTPSANGMLTIIAYPSANNVNFKVCNNLASSVTPGAITLNWRVVR